MLLAIDGNQRIIGANRVARTSLMLDDRGLQAGTSLWSIFERNVDIFRRQDRTDISARLLIAGSNDSRPALVTPPDHPMSASSNPTNCNLHTRPRLGSIDISNAAASTASTRRIVARRDASGAGIRGSAFGRKYRSVDAGWSRRTISASFCATI